MQVSLSRVVHQHTAGELLGWAARRSLGRATAPLRLLPDFLIIGAQRAGTTSLFHHLAAHPDVTPSFPKEVHYFTNHYHRGPGWYRSHFPLVAWKTAAQRRGRPPLLTGEATPYYLAYPHAAQRVRRELPNARLIVLLRNPVDRAYSHYLHEVASGIETLTFADALAREKDRLNSELNRMKQDEGYLSFNYQHFSYLERGLYAEQIACWLEHFDRDQLLILCSEEFSAQPARTFDRVLRFLGLRPWEPDSFRRYHQSGAAALDAKSRARLIAYFRPHNERLHDNLGIDFGWDA